MVAFPTDCLQEMHSSSPVSALPFKTETGQPFGSLPWLFALLKNYQENPLQLLKFRQETKEHKHGIVFLFCAISIILSLFYMWGIFSFQSLNKIISGPITSDIQTFWFSLLWSHFNISLAPIFLKTMKYFQ